VRAILARFGERLLPRIDQPAYGLSYANRRRVEIARALALKPRLLLLDEPTAGMNPTETAEMQALIAELKAEGLTILLIEHKLDMVMRLSDRVIVMDEGKKIAEGPGEDVRNDPKVIEAYFVPADPAAVRYQYLLWAGAGSFRSLARCAARPHRLSARRQCQRQVDDDEDHPRTGASALGRGGL